MYPGNRKDFKVTQQKPADTPDIESDLQGLMQEARTILNGGSHYRSFCEERHTMLNLMLKGSTLN